MRWVKAGFIVIAIGIGTFTVLVRRSPGAPAPSGQDAATPAHPSDVSPEDAMRRLREGNGRFVAQTANNAHHDAARRVEVAAGQHPFAVVLGCADSRVPPELIFDQGLGDLFVIRVAGEVAPSEVIGSIEYAVEHLGCRAVVVLGHQRCGAVEAAMTALTKGGATPEGDLGELIKEIEPSIKDIDRTKPDAMDRAVNAAALVVAHRLVSRSKLLSEMEQHGQIAIIPACYSLDTGKVELMEAVHAQK